MSAANTPTTKTPTVKVPAPKTPAAKKPAADANVEPKVKAPTKMDGARAIVAKLGGSARKDVIAAMITELGISKPCAATYYQSIKSKAEKAVATTA